MSAPRIKRSPELAQRILAELAEGHSLRAVCRMDGMPGKTFVLDWLDEDADFAAQYARVRERAWDQRAEEAVENAKNAEDAAKGRLAFDAERWYLGKMAPKKYGDKVQTEHSGTVTLTHEQFLAGLE